MVFICMGPLRGRALVLPPGPRPVEVVQPWCLLRGQSAGERGAADVVDQSRVEAKEGLALASTADQAGLAGDGVGEDRV